MLSQYKNPVFYLPDGPKNLAALFPGIDFGQVAEYYVELKDAADDVLLRTNTLKLGCCCSEEKVRIMFLNALGGFDEINFNPPIILHKTESSSFRRGLVTPLSKSETGEERFNVRSNETYQAVTYCYGEEDRAWLMECAGSTKAFMPWAGTQGQADDLLPIVIEDGTFQLKKIDNEFVYEFRIVFRMSNDNIHHRN